MRTRLARDEVTIVRAPTALDRYGNDEPQWGGAVRTLVRGCRVDPAAGFEEYDATRGMVVTRWRLYAPLGTDLTAADRVEAAGREFLVDGPPQPYDSPGNRTGHLVAVLKEAEG